MPSRLAPRIRVHTYARSGDAGAGRADRRGRRRNGRPRVWMADRARECGLVLQADAFPASPENATQAPQDRMALRRSQPAWSAAPIPHDRLPPACATDPAARRERPRPRVRRRHRRRPAPSRPAVRTRRVDRISRCRRSSSPGRAGANPSSDPGPSREQSTKLVSHGSDRFQVIPSKIQRTDRNRVSSMPSRLVGVGSGNHFVAATTSALCAVGHDRSYSPATSETARLPAAIALATRCRSRSVIRARGRTAAET